MRALALDLSRRHAWGKALLVAIVCAGCAVGLGAGTARAENSLISSSPADGDVVPISPPAMQLVFANPVTGASVVEAACNGSRVILGAPRVGATPSTLDVAVPSPLPRGECTISWKVLDSDGRPELGTFRFTVQANTVSGQIASGTAQPGAPAGSTGTAATTPDAATGDAAAADTAAGAADPAGAATPTSADRDDAPRVGGPLGLSRLVSALGLAALAGGLVLIVLAWPEGVEYVLTVRFLRSVWIVALVGTLGAVVFATANATGRSVGSSISPSAWFDLGDTTSGGALLARLFLTAACGWVVARPERVIDPATQLPALALPGLAVATMGLSRTGGDLELIGAAAGVVHALAMAVWLGGLILLSRVVLAGPGEADLVHAVRGFERISMPALVLTVASGAVQTYRFDGGSLFSSGHGGVLLLKALVVGVMVFVGLATREFIRTRLGRSETMSAALASRLQRALGAEALAGVVVLALSAWLLALDAPNVDAARAEVDDYAVSAIVRDDAAGVEVHIGLSPGVAGPNGALIDVIRPEDGLTSLRLTFVPPETATQTASVILSVPLTGAGAASLPEEAGMPLDAAGVWTVQMDATTTAGTVTGAANLTILAPDGELSPGSTVTSTAGSTAGTVQTSG